jgi:hypothetical protein
LDPIDYFVTLWPSLIVRIPVLIAWIVAVILSVLMLNRGGGRAERLLLIGSGLMLVNNLLSPFASVFMQWFIVAHRGDIQSVGLISGLVNIPLGIISLAGIVCLVVAFWTRWKTHGQQGDKAQVSQTAAE